MSIIPESEGQLQPSQYSGSAYLNSLANKYIVKPKNAMGIGGFVFDYEGDTDVDLESEITDHYMEDNSYVNDHIAHRPEIITLRGFVAELTYKPQGVIGIINSVQNKLSTVPAYLGKYTPGQLQTIQAAVGKATSVVNQVDQALSQVQNLIGLFPNSSPATSKQRKAFTHLYTLWLTGQVVTVETPFYYFNNMAVKRVRVTQPEATKYWCDISVTMKTMRFVNTQVSTFPASVRGGRNAINAQPPVAKGNAQGTSQSTSLLKQLFP